MRSFEIAKGFENSDVKMPKRATSSSAGYDISALEDVIIPAGKTVLLKTGLKAHMEKDEVLLLFPRSSLAVKRGLRLANSVAVIDADYCSNPDNDGHIMIPVFNFSGKDVEIKKGERVAQGIFINYLVTDDDEASGERKGGCGSTGA